MVIPDNTKIVFSGGSFTGSLPSGVIFRGASTEINATAEGSEITFEDGYELNSLSYLCISDCSVTATGLKISGELEIDSQSYPQNSSVEIKNTGVVRITDDETVEINEVSGAGEIIAANAIINSDCTVSKVTCENSAEFYSTASGNAWSIRNVSFMNGCDVASLESDNVLSYGTLNGFSWRIKDLSSSGIVNVTNVDITGNTDSVFGNNALVTIRSGSSFVIDKSNILSSSINDGDYTDVYVNIKILTNNKNLEFDEDNKITLTNDKVFLLSNQEQDKEKFTFAVKYKFEE